MMRLTSSYSDEQFSMAMAEVAAVTLANICLDVQIRICMFLHPSDILALRKTCRALQPSTRQRLVWVAALYRVCFDNTLFLPSFPISDMSDLEIEKAAMGPRRWIGLCGAYEKQHINDPDTMPILFPQTTRIIDDLFATEEVDFGCTDFFIVPGGRYLVSSSLDYISVLDLGYTSSADCKLLASVEPEGGSDTCLVQPTPDGMGLAIYSSNEATFSVYEIYPQRETPRLTRIAHHDFDPPTKTYLVPGTVIWCDCLLDRSIFRIWDYQLNHSISFSVVEKMNSQSELIATKTAVIVICEEDILILAIPPLLPQPPDFFDYDFTRILPPLFTITYPDGMVEHPARGTRKMVSSWYSDSSHPFYFDMLCQDSTRHRFQIKLEPDLSTASLRITVTSELVPHGGHSTVFQGFRICEDTLVSFWRYHEHYCGIYTGLSSARFSNVITHGGIATQMLLPDTGLDYDITLCPASGRFVRVDGNNSVAVLDFF